MRTVVFLVVQAHLPLVDMCRPNKVNLSIGGLNLAATGEAHFFNVGGAVKAYLVREGKNKHRYLPTFDWAGTCIAFQIFSFRV